MQLVADTNIFLAAALDEPEKAHIIRATIGAEIVSPELLPYELGNALSALVKRNRLSAEEAHSAFRIASLIPVRLIPVTIDDALRLACAYKMYAYDAYFLQCARQLQCPLLSLDRKMKQVANDLGIKTLELSP
ncbi:type II toxin-antitoxin system VapC family toxin [Candidatus Electronema sp. JM]|uniref:type II toxin-antitoxin system VapC family toxin n=1 Tax=Candidatus Electronema sp. JM TaxID=3401571 RepID=UPI003AA9673F